jgi:hypothetical protein
MYNRFDNWDMSLIILESPLAGEVRRNRRYAKRALRNALIVHKDAPMVSHLLYAQKGVLNDLIPEERTLGIDAGLQWKEVAKKHVFYTDYGMSNGMKYGLKFATKNNVIVEYRTIGKSNMLKDWFVKLFKIEYQK